MFSSSGRLCLAWLAADKGAAIASGLRPINSPDSRTAAGLLPATAALKAGRTTGRLATPIAMLGTSALGARYPPPTCVATPTIRSVGVIVGGLAPSVSTACSASSCPRAWPAARARLRALTSRLATASRSCLGVNTPGEVAVLAAASSASANTPYPLSTRSNTSTASFGEFLTSESRRISSKSPRPASISLSCDLVNLRRC